MNWRSGFSGSVVGCAAITCVGCGPALLWGGARGAAFIEWGGESSFVRKYAFLLNEHPTHTHLSSWTFGAWELGCSRALLLPSDRQEDGLAAGGGRESRRGLLRWPWRFLPEPHTFLRTSGSCRGAVAVAPAGAGLGKSLRWAEPGADEDLDLGRSAQCPQSDSSSAASAWARPRQATQWRWWSSGSMGPAQILHTEAITNSRWSRRFWYNCRGHRIYTVSSSSYLHALRQLASHLTGVSQ